MRRTIYGSICRGSSIKNSIGGGYLIGGDVGSVGNKRYCYFIVSENGQVTETKTIPTSTDVNYNAICNDILEISDSVIVLVGQSKNQMCIIKTNILQNTTYIIANGKASVSGEAHAIIKTSNDVINNDEYYIVTGYKKIIAGGNDSISVIKFKNMPISDTTIDTITWNFLYNTTESNCCAKAIIISNNMLIIAGNSNYSDNDNTNTHSSPFL